MRVVIMALVLLPGLACADIFKCTGPDGRINLTDRPCNGSVASPAEQVTVKVPQSADAQRAAAADAEREKRWEEQQRFAYVELPAREHQAAELMASPDPKAQALGREMAWQVHLGRQAFEKAARIRAERQEIDATYDATRRQLRGY